MKSRNHEIHANREYEKILRIIEKTVILVITETEAESVFHAFISSQDKTRGLSVPIFRFIS